MTPNPPLLVFTQGDPAGIGPEVVARVLLGPARASLDHLPLFVAEAAALGALRPSLPGLEWDRIEVLAAAPSRAEVAAVLARDRLPVLDPVGERRAVRLGASGAADAAGALAALDAGRDLVASGAADALVTAPLSKESIARHVRPGFAGHTEYLAEAAGLERYGRDYLMAFLAPDLQVALLSTHLPLRRALDAVTAEAIGEALDRLAASAGGRIAVAGLNPHAGEGGLLGAEDGDVVVPAVAAARARGLDVHGPESPDSLFARARRGEFDWVLALYHDQGLIAVKTAAFGTATNWTLGLPYLRTSVDHGTAFALAGRAAADPAPLAAVVAATLDLLAGRLPRRRE
ncbi:MAG TPA: 4-hydroxythreonine-4-phosphate dehydrogenase PdxA, partial [Thermoanaerobaculia bacterium]|nr:4-hydroxythreonine-4-phosphate dehydrogenase PdxA [Thermoanaerobaculia bacterium]